MKQYVVDPSSNTIMEEEQERLDGKVALGMAIGLGAFALLLLMAILPNRRRNVQQAKRAVAQLRPDGMLEQLGRTAETAVDAGKDAVKSVECKGLCKRVLSSFNRFFN
ncbi:hypothetical protein ACLGL1_06025 [Peptococcus simiae]|uniref:hypothetical protein n=1 Tax=Peptococcus simiae TaxID=1643805 RepID=UPI00397EDD8C